MFSDQVDLYIGSGGLRGENDEAKGYEVTRLVLLRRGTDTLGTDVIHLIGATCKSRRLQIQSPYGLGCLAAAHGWEDVSPHPRHST